MSTKQKAKPDSKPTRIRLSSLARFKRIAHQKRIPLVEVIDIASGVMHAMPRRQLAALIERPMPEQVE